MHDRQAVAVMGAVGSRGKLTVTAKANGSPFTCFKPANEMASLSTAVVEEAVRRTLHAIHAYMLSKMSLIYALTH